MINKVLLGFVGLGLFVMAFALISRETAQVEGSVGISNEYQSTTTSSMTVAPNIWNISATSSTDTSSHRGTFGSFVHTGSGTVGNISIYDATTTRASQRWPQATSSVLIATLPCAASANTYTYDVVYKRELLVVKDSSCNSTTTITYRAY